MAAAVSAFNRLYGLMLWPGREEEFRTALEEAPESVWVEDKLGMTLLQVAAWRGDIEIFKILIENDADPSYASGPDGKQTALHCAAGNSYFFAIYLTLLIKELAKGDFTELCIQVLKSAKISDETLLFLEKVLQLSLEKFELVLKQVLEEADPKYFSSTLKTTLAYRKTLESPSIKDGYTFITILKHTNEPTDFTFLLLQVLDKVYPKSSSVPMLDKAYPKSFSAPTSPAIHFSSPIFSFYNSSKGANSDESNLDENSSDFDRIVPHTRRWSYS